MKTNEWTKEDQLLLAQLEDKQRQAGDRYMIVTGDFLDAHQRKLAEIGGSTRKDRIRITINAYR